MLFSMTGFGRSCISASSGKLVVEIQSINRKYAEVFVSLPKEFSRFEPEVRKWVADSAMRGQITVRIHFSPNAESLTQLLPKAEVLHHLKLAWQNVASDAGFDPKQVDLPFVMLHFPFPQKVELAQDEDLQFLEKGVQEALKSLKEMKRKEGKALALDLSSRLKILQETCAQIESFVSPAASRMREKIQDKLKELLKIGENAEDKLFREIVLFTEKMDITEEITRLKSHFAQFQEILKSKDVPVGKKMDFLVQEVGREINTIGSKSMEAQIAHLVVEMKTELEKMREQIQNIE